MLVFSCTRKNEPQIEGEEESGSEGQKGEGR
jgi:hypothetical protein